MPPLVQPRKALRILGLLGAAVAASFSVSAWSFSGHILDGRLQDGVRDRLAAQRDEARPDSAPVANATIELWAVGSSGYGAGATRIGTTTGDANGNFNLSYTTSTTPSAGYYYCPTSTTQTYITSTGGSSLGGSNAAIKLLAVLGACGSSNTGIGSYGWVNINEVSTVAATYALQQFMDSTGAVIGTSSGNSSGLLRALVTAAVMSPQGLYATAGHVGSFLSTGSNSPAMLNTAADLLLICANTAVTSTGPATGTSCFKLFRDTGTPTNGTGTLLQAALNLAKTPASTGARQLYSDLISSNATLTSSGESCASTTLTNNLLFKPCLTSGPGDWMMALNYKSANTTAPFGIAIDASGYVWFTSDQAGLYDYLNVVNPTTTAISSAYNFYSATNSNFSLGQLAIDSNGYLVVPNFQASKPANASIDYFTLSNGIASHYKAFTDSTTNGYLNSATYVATDANGNAYSTSQYQPTKNPGTFTVTNAAGNTMAAGQYYLTCPNGPMYSLAVDKQGYVLTTSTYTAARPCGLNSYLATSTSTKPTSESPGANSSNPTTGWKDGVIGSASGGRIYGVAVNSTNDFYVSGDGVSVSEITRLVNPYSTRNTYSSTTTTSGLGGLNNPAGIAIDSADNVWVANLGGGTYALSSFTSALASRSGSTAYQGSNAMCTGAKELAIDASGNLWATCSTNGSVNEFVGVASPVKTPRTGSSPTKP